MGNDSALDGDVGLTRGERRRLAELEQTVARALSEFLAVGRALLAIRDERLYRATHSRFDDYLAERWRLSRSRGYQLMDAARVSELVSTTVDLAPPANEAQARELAPLLADEEGLVETWRVLRERHGEQLTAEFVRSAVEERLAREAYCREPTTVREPARQAAGVAVVPRSRRGGLYALGDHRLLCGDATAEPDVERLLEGERAALLFTSPPYLDLRRFGAGQNLAVDHLAGFLPLFAARAETIVVNLGILRREQAVLPYWEPYLEAASDAGLKLLAWNVWWKGAGGAHPAGRDGFFPPEHEWLFVFGHKTRPLYRTIPNANAGRLEQTSRRQPDGRLKKSPPLTVRSRRPIGSVLALSQEKANRLLDHPAVFPVALPQAYIEALTEPGELVIDPFLGAGTTLVACELTGRRCYGLELEPGYCDLTRSRYQALTASQPGEVA